MELNSSDATFQQRMQGLHNNIGGTVEKAFGIYNGSINNPPAPNPSSGVLIDGDEQNGAPIPFHISQKAIAHNHLSASQFEHIGTFSPNDLIALSNLFVTLEDFNSPIQQHELATYLVCNEGNYALKINDIDKLYDFAIKYGDLTDDRFKKEIDNYYVDNGIKHGADKEDQTIGLLKLMEDYDVGVDLYEAGENFENWKKLNLTNSGDDYEETSC